MQRWAAIEVADALELLSPDFKNDEVRAHAVATLQTKDDDELLYYLLQVGTGTPDTGQPCSSVLCPLYLEHKAGIIRINE